LRAVTHAIDEKAEPDDDNGVETIDLGMLGEDFTLTKAELAELLFQRVGLNKREAKDMVETFFHEIREALEQGHAVKLSGFGNFQLRDKPQRPGRNPKTGEAIPISARRVVTFHASQKLKSMVDRDSPPADLA
jgi:integration host factor subunit alpha